MNSEVLVSAEQQFVDDGYGAVRLLRENSVFPHLRISKLESGEVVRGKQCLPLIVRRQTPEDHVFLHKQLSRSEKSMLSSNCVARNLRTGWQLSGIHCFPPQPLVPNCSLTLSRNSDTCSRHRYGPSASRIRSRRERRDLRCQPRHLSSAVAALRPARVLQYPEAS